MLDYSHLTDATLRSTLEGDFSEDTICHSLNVTREALEVDEKNETLSGEVINARSDAYDDAFHAWNEEGDASGCLEALRTFWSV